MTSQQVIRNYLLIAGIYTLSASVIWGVNTLFLLDAGLTIFEVFVANAFFTLGMVLFEIPTGVIADTQGRRASFLLSVLVLAAGTSGYVGLSMVGAGIGWFCAMSIVLGLGFTFYSGAVEAWLVDALNETGFDDNLDQVFARGSMVTGGAMLVGTVGGGVLGSIDLAIPFVVRASLLITVFFVAYRTMHDIGFTPHPVKLNAMWSEMSKIARNSVVYGWQERPIKLLIIASTIHGAFMTWGFYAWQPYFLELLQRDAVWVAGVVAAGISISMIIGNSIVDYATRFCGKRTTLLIIAAGVQSVAIIGIGLANSFWVAAACLLVSTGTFGVIMPVRQAYIHKIIPSEQRATVVSFDSMVSNIGSVGGQSGLGYLSQVRSISSGYVAGGLFSFLAIPVFVAVRGLQHPADHIIGRGGKASSHAGQGIPVVAHIDSTVVQPLEGEV